MTSEHIIFCPQKTEEPPKKHNEAGPPEQLLPDALSQIVYKHTIHLKMVCTNEQCKGYFGKNE